jgi:signal transduction histidine kinase
MGEKELIVFIILITLIFFSFILGLVFFIAQFRKRKMIHDQEKDTLKAEYENEKLQIELKAQKDTMRDIGKEIHDGVGQKLTLASIYLKRHDMTNSNNLNIQEISELLDESLKELRQLSRTLVDSEKYHTKLSDLIQLEAKRVQTFNKINVFLIQNLEIDFSENVKHHIHRIIQEFLQNSVKHAQCSEINIRLEVKDRLLKVTCMDNGVGFDTKDSAGPGVGLMNIRKRVADMNGTVEIKSAPNQGTQLILQVAI